MRRINQERRENDFFVDFDMSHSQLVRSRNKFQKVGCDFSILMPIKLGKPSCRRHWLQVANSVHGECPIVALNAKAHLLKRPTGREACIKIRLHRQYITTNERSLDTGKAMAVGKSMFSRRG